MPTAHQGSVKYAYLDHDSANLNIAPPVQNQWYELLHAYDVRLIWCTIWHQNNEAASKNVEVRWTIDGNVYFGVAGVGSNSTSYVYRYEYGSFGGTDGLEIGNAVFNAAHYVDKRGHDFKIEIRMTSAPGTNEVIDAYAVYETLEQT